MEKTVIVFTHKIIEIKTKYILTIVIFLLISIGGYYRIDINFPMTKPPESTEIANGNKTIVRSSLNGIVVVSGFTSFFLENKKPTISIYCRFCLDFGFFVLAFLRREREHCPQIYELYINWLAH